MLFFNPFLSLNGIDVSNFKMLIQGPPVISTVRKYHVGVYLGSNTNRNEQNE